MTDGINTTGTNQAAEAGDPSVHRVGSGYSFDEIIQRFATATEAECTKHGVTLRHSKLAEGSYSLEVLLPHDGDISLPFRERKAILLASDEAQQLLKDNLPHVDKRFRDAVRTKTEETVSEYLDCKRATYRFNALLIFLDRLRSELPTDALESLNISLTLPSLTSRKVESYQAKTPIELFDEAYKGFDNAVCSEVGMRRSLPSLWNDWKADAKFTPESYTEKPYVFSIPVATYSVPKNPREPLQEIVLHFAFVATRHHMRPSEVRKMPNTGAALQQLNTIRWDAPLPCETQLEAEEALRRSFPKTFKGVSDTTTQTREAPPAAITTTVTVKDAVSNHLKDDLLALHELYLEQLKELSLAVEGAAIISTFKDRADAILSSPATAIKKFIGDQAQDARDGKKAWSKLSSNPSEQTQSALQFIATYCLIILARELGSFEESQDPTTTVKTQKLINETAPKRLAQFERGAPDTLTAMAAMERALIPVVYAIVEEKGGAKTNLDDHKYLTQERNNVPAEVAIIEAPTEQPLATDLNTLTPVDTVSEADAQTTASTQEATVLVEQIETPPVVALPRDDLTPTQTTDTPNFQFRNFNFGDDTTITNGFNPQFELVFRAANEARKAFTKGQGDLQIPVNQIIERVVGPISEQEMLPTTETFGWKIEQIVNDRSNASNFLTEAETLLTGISPTKNSKKWDFKGESEFMEFFKCREALQLAAFIASLNIVGFSERAKALNASYQDLVVQSFRSSTQNKNSWREFDKIFAVYTDAAKEFIAQQ